VAAATLPPTETALNRRPNTTREIRQFADSTTATDNYAQQYRGGRFPCAWSRNLTCHKVLLTVTSDNENDLPSNNVAIEFWTFIINVNCVVGL